MPGLKHRQFDDDSCRSESRRFRFKVVAPLFLLVFILGVFLGRFNVFFSNEEPVFGNEIQSNLKRYQKGVEVTEHRVQERGIESVADSEVYESLLLLKQLDPVGFQQVHNSMSDTLLLAMVEQIGPSSPEGVARVLESLGTEQRAELSIVLVEGWCESDPKGALTWLESQRNYLSNEEFKLGLGDVYAAYAKRDPAAVYRTIEESDDSEFRDRMVVRVASAWADLDMSKAVSWLEEMDTERYSPGAYTESYLRVMKRYATSDPEGAALIIGQLESEELKQKLVSPVVSALFEKDEDGAVEWLTSIENRETREEAVKHLIRSTADVDSGVAIDLLLSQPGLFSGNQEFEREVWDAVVQADLDGAIKAFAIIPEEGRAAAAEAVVWSWLAERRDMATLEDWYLDLDGGAARDGAASAFAEHYVDKDPVSALVWAGNIEEDSERVGLMKTIIRNADASSLPHLVGNLVSMNVPAVEQAILADEVESRFGETFTPLVLPSL